MPSGALTLLEATKNGGDKVAVGMIETIIEENPLLERLPWMPFEGIAYVSHYEQTLPNVQFRKVGGTYSKSFGTKSKMFWGVAILGGEIGIDNFLVNVTGSLASNKAEQYALMAKANSMRFGYEFFNGTGEDDGFKGLKALITEGQGQSYANSTVGATPNLDKIDEAEDLFRNQGGPDEWLVNRRTRTLITRAARALGLASTSLIETEKNTLGKRIMSYNGVPLTVLGDAIDGSGNVVASLPFTEDPGDGAFDTCSMYAIKYGPRDVTGLLGKGGEFSVKDFGETEAAPSHMGRLEWYPGLAVFNQYSLVRVTGILAA
jgi:hypothetical protein